MDSATRNQLQGHAPMTPMEDISVRRMVREDLAEGLRLTRLENWSYGMEDWEFHWLLGRGWLACDGNGVTLGTALWWPHGDDHGTVGMVVVSREHQGRGVGRRLMDAILNDAGPRTLGLISTKAGTKLYHQCGFRDQGEISQHHGILALTVAPSPVSGATLRSVTTADLTRLAHWDAPAFGAARAPVLAAVFESGGGVLAERNGQLAGFALARRTSRGTVIGPVVAEDELLAIELIGRQLQSVSGYARLDIPTDAARLGGWLESIGLGPVDPVTAMLRGAPRERRTSARIFGLVSQALN